MPVSVGDRGNGQSAGIADGQTKPARGLWVGTYLGFGREQEAGTRRQQAEQSSDGSTRNVFSMR